MAAEQTNEAVGELIDIELPVEPGLSWFSVLQDAGWFTLIFVVIALLFVSVRYSRWFDRSLILSPLTLRWHLYRVQRQFNRISDRNLTSNQCRPLFDWMSQFSRIFKRAQYEPNRLLDELEVEEMLIALKVKSEAMVFSNEPVSRETYSETLAEAFILLNRTLYYRFFFDCVLRVFKFGRKS